MVRDRGTMRGAFGVFAGLLTRKGAAGPRPAPAGHAPPPEDTIALIDAPGSDDTTGDPPAPPRPRALITMLGPLDEVARALLDSSVAGYDARGFRAVLVGSDLPLSYLVGATHPVELLPRRQDLRNLPEGAYLRYLRLRWDLIHAKWTPDVDLHLGLDFAEFLACQKNGVTRGQADVTVAREKTESDR